MRGMFLLDLYSGYIPRTGKEACRVTYIADGADIVLNHLEGDRVLLPDEPTRKPESIYTYTFSHGDGYTEGMVADSDITLVAVFDRHDAMEENIWLVHVVLVPGSPRHWHWPAGSSDATGCDHRRRAM